MTPPPIVPPTVDVLVVGAGMAGLIAARRLTAEGAAVVVVDKGRAVGGRMATRRRLPATFDHGAQHISARSPAFRDEVAGWVDAGVAREWIRTASRSRSDRAVEPRYVGVGGMRRIPEHLAAGLDVHTDVRLDRIGVEGDLVHADTSDGRRFVAHSIVLTPPAPQTVALLADLPVEARVLERLDGATYRPCLAVMVSLDGPSGLPDGHLALDGPVAWLADNHHKGVSDVPSVTVHSSPEFARRHLESDPSDWVPRLLEDARRHLGSSITDAVGHRWRYSEPIHTFDDGAMIALDRPRVIVGGELFGGARVEGAFLSGVAAARSM